MTLVLSNDGRIDTLVYKRPIVKKEIHSTIPMNGPFLNYVGHVMIIVHYYRL